MTRPSSSAQEWQRLSFLRFTSSQLTNMSVDKNSLPSGTTFDAAPPAYEVEESLLSRTATMSLQPVRRSAPLAQDGSLTSITKCRLQRLR